jgi:Protein of unknown function (DUF3667)
MTQAETAQPVSATCSHCGATTGGAYCPVCGQDTKLEPPSVGEYFHEILDHFVHLEGKLWRTLGTLVFLPGKLPHDYLANKRARYIKPLKLYFAAIALAFAGSSKPYRLKNSLKWRASAAFTTAVPCARPRARLRRAVAMGIPHSPQAIRGTSGIRSLYAQLHSVDGRH